MLHEQIVPAVVSDVVVGDEQAEGGEHKTHHDLGVQHDEHGAASFALAAQRASLASVSRQTGVSLLIFSLRQVMARPAPTSTPGQQARKSSRQDRASINFLRGGMK